MSRALIILRGATDRERAARWAAHVPYGTRIEFKSTKRSIPQNSLLWSMLGDIARQVPWHSVKLSSDDWKLIFLDALKRELRIVPNLDGTGFVNLGRSSSDLTMDEMSDLIELIRAFGANHGVIFIDQRDDAPSIAPDTPEPNSSEALAPPAASPMNPAPGQVLAPGAGPNSESLAHSPSAPQASEERQASPPGASALHGDAGLPDQSKYAAAMRRHNATGQK